MNLVKKLVWLVLDLSFDLYGSWWWRQYALNLIGSKGRENTLSYTKSLRFLEQIFYILGRGSRWRHQFFFQSFKIFKISKWWHLTMGTSLAPHYINFLKVRCPAYILHYSILQWHLTFLRCPKYFNYLRGAFYWLIFRYKVAICYDDRHPKFQNSGQTKWRQIFSRYVESITTWLCFDSMNINLHFALMINIHFDLMINIHFALTTSWINIYFAAGSTKKNQNGVLQTP